MTPKWGFGVAMLPEGALCFYQARFGRTVLPKWPHFGRVSSPLYFTVFLSLEGHASARRVSHAPCFRQTHCFVQAPLRFLPVLPNPTCARSHIWGFPIRGVRQSRLLNRRLGSSRYVAAYALSERWSYVDS